MTTLAIAFMLAFIVSLCLTPLVRKLGIFWGVMDYPSGRKVHAKPVPRIGGIAFISAFFISLLAVSFSNTDVARLMIFDGRACLVIAGAAIVIGTGVVDDFQRLGYRVKFLFQIIAVTFAFFGGLGIKSAGAVSFLPDHVIVSYLVTVFWFLLFINAVNLIDGLDGLAGGICFFVSAVMVVLALAMGDYLTALYFAALAGALLGFLPYNFNPASVFMGDGGSYFLGYSLAALSVMGSYKTQVSATLMIPLIALGVPIFDVILSPVRRFLRARAPFRPDMFHIHHRLVSMGLNTRRAVLVIYLITCALCLFAVILANYYDEFGGFLLVILGACAFVLVKRLGYLRSVTSVKAVNWLRDVAFSLGISRHSRKLLDYQLETMDAGTDVDVWKNLENLLNDLDFDHADYYSSVHTFEGGRTPRWVIEDKKGGGLNHRRTPLSKASVTLREEPPLWSWDNERSESRDMRFSHSLLRFEFPVMNEKGEHFGTIVMVKDMKRSVLERHSLRRLDVMRTTMGEAMGRLKKKMEATGKALSSEIRKEAVKN